ncbi:hypothetical protein Q3W71_05925 [Micromonospora sp. C28SCA-DRY-2]|uniref:hypothetical protein n=1 Tax=Micromonospora sp. C28SCA-DRY-2 TaxID=3059522 RepID=UPI00267447EE|nr:hypothetical protein [Micromonospora sp. C28SCA-DRY-2]MDO3701218.1 hypothetical protein [Micromonospora sp. C28SCA-DRY-2]
MIERGSGRTSGLTDWRLMDVASMWACLQDHDTTNHWKQVAGWRKVCDLAQTHLARLQEYRRGLAEAWPPETNEAARAYLRELDELIDKVRRTHDAATANYTALSAATQAIGSSRAQLEKVYEEWAVKLQQKRAYEATAADPKAAMGSRVPDQPVTDADLERLNVQARGIMYGLSTELQHAQVMLQKPPPIRPKKQTENPDIYGGAAPPEIPPIVPMPIVSVGTTPSVTRRPDANRPVPGPTAPRGGPVLGAASGALAPAPPSLPGATSTAPPAASSSIGVPPVVPGAQGGANGLARGQTGPASRPVAGPTSGTPHASPPGSPRAMPPGGLIGGTPGMGLSQPAAGNNQPRRVNPIGGVIGGGGAGTAPSGGAGSRPGGGRSFAAAHGMPPIGGGPALGGIARVSGADGPHNHAERNVREPHAWDPDHPWAIDQGVTPVVRSPDEDGPIDPGPAIGLNR